MGEVQKSVSQRGQGLKAVFRASVMVDVLNTMTRANGLMETYRTLSHSTAALSKLTTTQGMDTRLVFSCKVSNPKLRT